ncbi:hypothetical protein ACLB2K_045793 [Fragaria x ananassa]
MNGFRSLQFLLFLTIPLFFASVSAKDGSNKAGGSSVALKVLIVVLGVAAVAGFGVFLFRIWQRKKREEQHARLLKLFEDDDELEAYFIPVKLIQSQQLIGDDPSPMKFLPLTNSQSHRLNNK